MNLSHNIQYRRRRVFKNPKEISKHLHCCICQDVFEDPARLQCGHTFCYLCIENWAVLKDYCPVCKRLFGERMPEKDMLAAALIDDLQVKCVYPNCIWEGLQSTRNMHQRFCVFRPRNQEIFQQYKGQIIQVTDLDQKSDIEIYIINDQQL